MTRLAAPRLRRETNFDFAAKRRREIVLHARYVGAAETEDFRRWLIAWVWHNPKATNQIWSLMEAAKRMGGKITAAEASAIIEEASITPRAVYADDMARFLGVTYVRRQALRLTTIGSIDVGRRARKELRKRRAQIARADKRRTAGMRPQSESLSATEPWRELGISRRTWYRRNKARRKVGTTLSTAFLLSSEDRVVPSGEEKGGIRAALRAEERKRQSVFADGVHDAVDRLESLPVELRLLALGLPVPEKLARAA